MRVPGSRGKPYDGPRRTGVSAAVDQPVVQPVAATLPELDDARHHPDATPVRWAGHVAAVVLTLELSHPLLQHGSVCDGRRLGAGPGRKLRAGRPGGEVGVRRRRVDRRGLT